MSRLTAAAPAIVYAQTRRQGDQQVPLEDRERERHQQAEAEDRHQLRHGLEFAEGFPERARDADA